MLMCLLKERERAFLISFALSLFLLLKLVLAISCIILGIQKDREREVRQASFDCIYVVDFAIKERGANERRERQEQIV